MAEQYFLGLNGGVGGEKGEEGGGETGEMEKHYLEAYREKLPGLWFHEHECQIFCSLKSRILQAFR